MEFARLADRENDVRIAAREQLSASGATHSEGEIRSFTLAQILRDEADWQGAYDALMNCVRDPDRLCEAARWLRDPAPPLACKLYALAIDTLIDRKNNRAYAAAASLLMEAMSSFDAIGPGEFGKCLTRL